MAERANKRDAVRAMREGLNGPVRMCVICRRRFEKAALTRHVLTTQGILRIDAEQIEPGRGWYLCTDDDCAKRFACRSFGTRRTADAKRKLRTVDADSSHKGGKHV